MAPTKADIQGLIEAYARKIYSADKAGFRIEQRLHNTFMQKLERLWKKYPEIDLASDEFYAQLESKAREW